MLINFHFNFDKPKEKAVAFAFDTGCPYRVRFTESQTPLPEGDLDIAIGIKSGPLVKQFTRPYLWLDKPYNRNWPKWWRIILNGHHPSHYVQVKSDRAEAQGWRFSGWRNKPNGHFLIAGSSDKLHAYFGLPPANEWAEYIVKLIRSEGYSNKIIYRPKPSFKNARPIEGATFSHGVRSIADDLKGAFAMVTYTSAAALDALRAGIPVFSIGPSIARSISAVKIGKPFYADADNVQAVFNILAYCQWSLDEIKNGSMWEFVSKCL